MGLRDQGWRRVGLPVEMGGFRDQGVEMGGFRDQGWRRVGLRHQGVETGRFKSGDG